jgi:hypothetical protein
MRVVTVATISPAITSGPSGAFAVLVSDIGNLPTIIASAVISTGRIRAWPASIAAATGIAMLGQPRAGEVYHEHSVRGGRAHAHDGAGQSRNGPCRSGRDT